MRLILWLKYLFVIFIFSSCASSPKHFLLTSKETIEGLGLDEFNKHLKQGLSAWKKRHHKSELEDFIKHFELCARAPQELSSQILRRYKVYEMLSRGYYLLAYYHESDLGLRKKHWQTGAYWAEKGLYTNEKFKNGVAKYGEYASALKYLTSKELGSIYWYLANIGMWAKNSGVGTSIKYIRLIKAMIRKIEKHNPKFFYGGTARFWGGYYAVIPPFAGGDLVKSRRYFEKSMKIAPEYLGTKVLFANIYALKMRDRELFINSLQKVINADVSKAKAIIPENILEKKSAQALLEQVDELF